MLAEEFVSSVCGPRLASGTSAAKDVGVYCHTLSPTYSVTCTYKKSATPTDCLAASPTHVFAAQHEKAYVHVYSRLRGNQEAFVPFSERIRCLALAGDVLVLGTAEGRLLLWETCTGRLVSTPPRHVQAVSCLAVAPYHVMTGSDDSDIHVWSLPRLLELDSAAERQPERTLAHHRAAVTSLAVSGSANPDTCLCVSAARDKSCIVWNYATGHVLRTLLFPSAPLRVALDPAARALFVSSEDGALYLQELFSSSGSRPLLGPAAEDPSTVVQAPAPLGLAPADTGPASCLGVSYDGTVLLTGHAGGQILRWDVTAAAADETRTPAELAKLGAAVTNIVFFSPLASTTAATKAHTIVKPTSQARRDYIFTSQLESSLPPGQQQRRFDTLASAPGFPLDALEDAICALEQPGTGAAETELAAKNEELWEIVNEQRALQKETMQRYIGARTQSSA